MSVVMALDPALKNTACVVFKDGKPVKVDMVKTKASPSSWLTSAEKSQQRVTDLVRAIQGWIDEHRPDMVCAEQALGGARSAAAASSLGMVAGCVYTLSLAPGAPPWSFIRVHDVKRAMVGKATATKAEMIEAAVRRYPSLRERLASGVKGAAWKGEAEHIADAVAVYEAFKATPAGRLMCGGG